MAESRRRAVSPLLATYLKAEIESGGQVRAKQALQHICKLYRTGAVIPENNRIGLEIAILGVLSSSSSDEKVRRWALATLAYVGRKGVSERAVLKAITEYPDEPQVVAAAIATFFKLDENTTQKLILDKGVCSPEIVALSALQTTDPKKLDISSIKVDIERADAISLKLALLLIGLDRAPPRIFHPRHTNGAIVKELGRHDEPIVSQYSVWAVAESRRLGISNLGISIKSLDEKPANVRSYVYRLYAEDSEESTRRHDIIYQGSKDSDPDARMGCAIGLRDSYYDGLEGITVDWLYDEEAEDVRLSVLDHIAAQSGRLESYKTIALEQYNLLSADPRKRARLDAAASGTELFSNFKRILFEEEGGGLFQFSGGTVTNNNFVNNGSIQGAISQSGTATNSGQMQVQLSASDAKHAISTLDKLMHDVQEIPVTEELKKQVSDAVMEAKSTPTKSNIGKVAAILEKAETALKAISGMTDHATKIGSFIMALSPYFS
jgi:hypothetical protein